MVKQAVKKGAGIKNRKSMLAAFKEKNGLTGKANNIADKPWEWISMPQAFQDVTRLPGLPCGRVISVLGHTNTGKSTLINHALANAQRQGYLPVIIDTENSFSFPYAKNMGFEAEPIYSDVEIEDVDYETGDVKTHTENLNTNWDGDFLYYNNFLLAEQFGDIDYATGGKEKKKRTTAVIEDVAMLINSLLDAQENGDILQGLFFVWDSVGSIMSYKEYANGKINNNMWAAAAISQAFQEIVNNRIPSSRKVYSTYTNTLLFVNKIYLSMPVAGGMPQIQTKGGQSLTYATRLQILMGGQLSSGVRNLNCTYKTLPYKYAIETRIKILKNHLDEPYNVSSEGKLVAGHLGFISVDDVDQYKKEHISRILKNLNKLNDDGHTIVEEDVTFSISDEIPLSES